MPISATPEMGRVVRLSTVACLVVAGLILIALTLTGRPTTGALIAAGVLLGAGNAPMTRRLASLGVPFAATSMLRILTMTALAILLGLIGGMERVFLVVAGVGFAQLLMAGSALRELARR